jgi:actinin alpha
MPSISVWYDVMSFPQDQLQALVAFEAETLTYQPEMDSAEEIHRQTQAALIFDNKHSKFSMKGLRANWTGLLLAIQRAKNETENQILIRDSKGLSEDQIKEYRQSFDHFDRVRAPLQSLFCSFNLSSVFF